MKKAIIVLLLVAVAGINCAFAELPAVEMSAGAGIKFLPWWTSSDYEDAVDKMEETTTMQDLGFFAFFDATYAMLDIGYSFNMAGKDKRDENGVKETLKFEGSMGYLDLDLLLKYPFDIGKLKLFPAAGISYRLNLFLKDEDGNNVKEFMDEDQKNHLNQFWLKGGLGADIAINESFYIRPLILFGYKFKSKLESDGIKAAKDLGATTASINTFGFDISVSAGYKF